MREVIIYSDLHNYFWAKKSNYTMNSKINPACVVCRACCNGVFKGLSDELLEDISKKKSWNLIKKGDFVFREGSIPGGLYCLFDGNVKISKIDEEGKEQIVRLAKRGSFMGYRALLCNDVYHASAIAIEDSHVCAFKKEVFLELLYSKPEIAAQTIQILTSDLRFAENMMMNIAQKHAKGRIAEIILVLEEFYGICEKDQTINSTLKREDIGHLAGTTTETSIRVLSEFNKDGIIDLVGKKLRIANRDRLIELSNRSEALPKR